jgi:hypothetical protein
LHRMASRNVSNSFTAVDRSVLLHSGTILKETWPKWLNGFVFLRNKFIAWNAWSYHVQDDPEKSEEFVSHTNRFNKTWRPLSGRLTSVSARGVRQFLNFI